MIKKLVILVFVLLLLAVSWFKPAFCQTMSQDSLLRQMTRQVRPVSGNINSDNNYTSPEIYGEIPLSGVPDTADNVNYENRNTVFARHDRDTSKTLEPFGYDLFRAPSELTPPSEVADAAEYILGPGDNIIVYLWGRVEKEYDLTVDRQGKVFIPKIGETTAWGMTLRDFTDKVKNKLASVYTDFNVSISLGKIRSIRVYLTGEIKRPGAYTVSSLTTLFNVLYLAGGPNQRGSLRDIRLIRNNKIEKHVDLYSFLLKGNTDSDIRLTSGDAVFVPITGPRVTISGEVKRPAIYELADSETVSQLLDLAGGPTAEAHLDRIMLDRISPDDERVVIDINMNPMTDCNPDDIALTDGDHITVFSVYDMRRNVVAVAGMVKHPGQWERTDSTTLHALLDKGELLPENVYTERANLFRRYPDRRTEIIPVNLNKVIAGEFDMPLQDLDSLHVYSIDEIRWERYVFIDGEVKKPGRYHLYENMTIDDLIFLAGNLTKDAYQVQLELARVEESGQVASRYIDLSREDMRQTLLQEDDRIYVRRTPDWFLHRQISIDGAVRFPGQYSLRSGNETLYQLIKRAGGFTEKAFPKGIIFRRQSIGQDLLRQNLPGIISNTEPYHEDSLGVVSKQELFTFNPENMNRIIVDIEKIIKTDGREGDIRLQANDDIFVPETPSGISVMGAVAANGTIKFETGRKVKYFIQRAGNFTNQADKSATRLIKADGQVFSGGGNLGKRVEIGDVVYVPSKVRRDRDWLKTLSTTVSILGGIATSVFIIDRL
ncbi:MAG: SLBB domain-containing protein [candidate division Zixibacteria bacterium]|nr:SLBB domain-containing protein [candidate division Zixibacteria bacterium]